jgi:hypothetical protein
MTQSSHQGPLIQQLGTSVVDTLGGVHALGNVGADAGIGQTHHILALGTSSKHLQQVTEVMHNIESFYAACSLARLSAKHAI